MAHFSTEIIGIKAFFKTDRLYAIAFICFGVSSHANCASPAPGFSASTLHRPPFLKSIAMCLSPETSREMSWLK